MRLPDEENRGQKERARTKGVLIFLITKGVFDIVEK